MKNYLFKRLHLDLNMKDMTDDIRDQTVAGVLQVAPTSTLILADPAMQASVAALGAKSTKFKATRDTVSADEQKMAADIELENQAREAVDREILVLVGLVSTRGKTAAEVTGAGFKLRPPPPPPLPFAAPDALDLRFPEKEKGKFIVTPHGIGKRRCTWAVQMSADPYGPTTWVEVVGPGKSRTLTGASGTKVWVRYAMVRGNQQSAWGTPVLVTFP